MRGQGATGSRATRAVSVSTPSFLPAQNTGTSSHLTALLCFLAPDWPLIGEIVKVYFGGQLFWMG